MGHVQQWLAVRALAVSLPPGCNLIVKEHPTTFIMNEYTRDKSFYEAIAGLPQVSLAPIDEDPFKLIDSSVAVATITGTVGIQAICRGQPVIVFGAAAYRGCPGVFAVNNIAQVEEAIQTIFSGGFNLTQEKLYEYLKWVERHSIVDTDASRKVWERLIRLSLNHL